MCVVHGADCSVIHTLSVSQGGLGSVALNRTGEWLALGCAPLGQLLVWEWQSETYVLKQQGHGYDSLNTLAYSPDGQVGRDPSPSQRPVE